MSRSTDRQVAQPLPGESVQTTRGTLVGIGTGPGDPELLTLKAIRAIRESDYIAVPDAGSGESTALSIVEPYIEDKPLLECRFAMSSDMASRREARQIAAQSIIELLDQGFNVGFITLGDPTTYSTYMYVHTIVSAAGYATQIVPGITSYTAAAAALQVAVCEGDEAVVIIPARHAADIEELLDAPGNKVIMKSGKNLQGVLDMLKSRGLGSQTLIASRVTMPGEQLFYNIDEFEQADSTGYFTLAIVKPQANPQTKAKGNR